MLATTPEWQRMLTLAPVFVIGAGVVAAVLILLGRAFVDSFRESGHKRLMLVTAVAIVGAVVLLTYLGIKLPKE